MEEINQKKTVFLTNNQFKERFQFLLSVNDNIICQRYFKVNGLNARALDSYELKEALDNIVDEIKDDLVSKSRIFLWYTTPSPLKITGFLDRQETSYIDCSVNTEDFTENNECLKPYDTVFKFSFLDGEKIVYERIWDGTVYPKYVRNSVDLSNSDAKYKGRDMSMASFTSNLVMHMTQGREDLIHKLINQICGVLSHTFVEQNGLYTDCIEYGDKTYYYSINRQEKQYMDGWKYVLKEKTLEYYPTLFPSAKYCEKIDKKY